MSDPLRLLSPAERKRLQPVAQSPPDCVLDGEVVAFDQGRTSFARLQPRIHPASPDQARRSGVPVYYYLFDVQSLAGADVTTLPLRRRKALLRSLLRKRRCAVAGDVPNVGGRCRQAQPLVRVHQEPDASMDQHPRPASCRTNIKSRETPSKP
ncbi:hypothetical protein [Streptomyces sp. NPDC059455]|uniref:ATP-dependent DNA ligase n=1 Tax=Streptomyces sp. NPDC059455 TaxID=3346837 RepID=UPI0036C62EB5